MVAGAGVAATGSMAGTGLGSVDGRGGAVTVAAMLAEGGASGATALFFARLTTALLLVSSIGAVTVFFAVRFFAVVTGVSGETFTAVFPAVFLVVFLAVTVAAFFFAAFFAAGTADSLEDTVFLVARFLGTLASS